MILPIAFLIGAIFGWVRAAKRGGNRLDSMQYAATHGIAFLLLAAPSAESRPPNVLFIVADDLN